jgi:hypothetical protein
MESKQQHNLSINLDYLNRIDWHNHDGVNLGMINDFMRNQFYDKILSRYVKDQNCTDIGFGTGLLSMLALKHGAGHIRAFEIDSDRFELGKEIIRRLNMQDRIELINEKYDRSYTSDFVTFTETVNGNLWWEGLWNSLPVDDKNIFLPGSYFLEIWAAEVPASFASGLQVIGESQSSFNPGVDIDPEFVSVVNTLSGKIPLEVLPLPAGIVNFNRQQETAWGWIPYLRAVQSGQVVSSYSVKYYSEDIDDFVLNIETSKWKNKTILIVPRMGMRQDSDKLYLDTGHWGPGENPILLVDPCGTLVVKHNVRNGLITYSMES